MYVIRRNARRSARSVVVVNNTGQKREVAATGAVTLILHFGSAANVRYTGKYRNFKG